MQPQIIRAVIVCALGYFIDVFDIQLLAVLRVPSLTDLGVPADKLAAVGGYLLNAQMLGILCGAFLWGWVGDRFGRLKSLYGSILLYSLGTFACSLSSTPLLYGFLRFITGLGLAGETGAAITLIAELMPTSKRTWGIIIAAGIGFLGPVFAVLISWILPWRMTYIFAGILGLIILILRARLSEPALFQKIYQNDGSRGSLRILIQPQQAKTMLYAILIGGPLAFTWNILNFFSVEFSHAILLPGEVFDQKTCLMLFYIGTSCGDIISGILSQLWQSRRRSYVALLLLGMVVGLSCLLIGSTVKLAAFTFYMIYFILGISGGCWVLMTTIYAEHFGINIRATTSILLTNIVRALAIPIVFVFHNLSQTIPMTYAAALLGMVLYTLAFFGLSRLRETHNLDLDYVEKYE